MSICPTCHREFFAAVTDITPFQRPREPKPGDIGICQDCATAFVIEQDGSFRALTPRDIAQMTDEDNMIAILRAQKEVQQR